VLFGTVRMEILSATPTEIRVAFPRGGFPTTGPMNVTVRNLSVSFVSTGQHVLAGGFTFDNGPATGCHGAGTGTGTLPWGDMFVLTSVLVLCLGAGKRWRPRPVRV
jgi:hypothetical protein